MNLHPSISSHLHALLHHHVHWQLSRISILILFSIVQWSISFRPGKWNRYVMYGFWSLQHDHLLNCRHYKSRFAHEFHRDSVRLDFEMFHQDIVLHFELAWWSTKWKKNQHDEKNDRSNQDDEFSTTSIDILLLSKDTRKRICSFFVYFDVREIRHDFLFISFITN